MVKKVAVCCFGVFCSSMLSVNGKAATPTKTTKPRPPFYIGAAGGIGRAPYTLVGLRLGWKYGIFTPAEIGVGPRVWAFSPPAVFMQAVDIGFGRIEWGASYHWGHGKRSMAYARKVGTLSEEERVRFRAPHCDDGMCTEEPVVVGRNTDYSLLYTHIGVGVQHQASKTTQFSATLGYSYLAHARISVQEESGDEALGKRLGALGYPGFDGWTIINEHDSGLYVQVGLNYRFDVMELTIPTLPFMAESPEVVDD